MAITKTLTYAIGQTINTGNFNSVRIDFSETVELEPGDDRETVATELRNRVVTRLVTEASKIGRA